MEITREQDEAMSRSIDAHDEALKRAVELGVCLKCRVGYKVEVNPRNLTFRCRISTCGWSAIYPIRTLGNSERAQRDEELDLIALAEKEVIANGRIALKAWRAMGSANGTAFTIAKTAFDEAQCEWLASVVLLEAREADRSKLAEHE